MLSFFKDQVTRILCYELISQIVEIVKVVKVVPIAAALRQAQNVESRSHSRISVFCLLPSA
jgi:hypothetical protein